MKGSSGRYEAASEVVRAGLRALEREEVEFDASLAALHKALDDGDASGEAEDGVAGRVRVALRLRSARPERLRYTRRSEADLDSIAAYTPQKWGFEQAQR